MKRPNTTERSFLTMLSNAGGQHRFGPEDKVTSEAHRMIRSLDRRGYVSVESENGITTVTLTALGRDEVENG
jgi:hypothetical protein